MRIGHEPVIADNRNVFGVCRLYDANCLRGIVRQQDESINTGVQKVLDLLELEVVVAIGGTGDGLCTKLLSTKLKFVQIGLPALALGGFDRKSNLDFRSLRRLCPARDHVR